MSSRRPLESFDVERVRFGLERELAEGLAAIQGFDARRRSFVPQDPARIRRRLLGEALRLTESMAPQAHGFAREAQRILGVEGELELYQSSGEENAALHLVRSPILLEVQGRLLSLIDEGAGLALFGHELGHYLAHGPWDELGSTLLAGAVLAEHGLLEPEQVELARRGIVAREVTADRLGLLACQDLDAALRLEMIATTGLSGDALTWDTRAYLEQSRELMAATLAEGEEAIATTHPEHSLRAWAAWLFSETEVYRELTGQGAGKRKLAEVDALVARALGGAKLEAGGVREEPPMYLLECALASAVLVALADGDMTPEEVEALEDAFAARVPGWSELLDHEIALERFYETGGLVSRGGIDFARRLFVLLTHVVGADSVVDAREVQMVLAIGEALGFAARFRRWLEPAVAAMGAELETDLEAPMAIPLPARKAEVTDALDALCDSVDRSRIARISPRRLLRLAGGQEEAPAKALDRVAHLFERRGIEVDPSLTGVPLDVLVWLRATREPPRSAESAVELGADRKALIAALTRLRDELISGDGRSPSVRLRSLSRGRVFDLQRLDAVRTGTAERALALVQSGQRAVLVTPDDAGRHDAARACTEDLRQLDRTQRDRREETGANDLFMGYPLLLGSVALREQTSGGYPVRGPLMLFPVELERDARGARGFSVKPRDEDPIANLSLLQLLFNKAGLAMPDELARDLAAIAADPARGVPDLIARLGEVGLSIGAESTALGPFRDRNDELDAGKPFLAIEEVALLGIFPQSSSDLLQDYDALLKELAAGTQDLGALMSAGVGLLPAELRGGTVPEVSPHEPGWPVLPSDPSQREVARVCAENLVTVVDGPPGTGKSQVIVNLVADALRRGARVAVVAEKRAALDVVNQRLEGVGLGHAVAVVHDVNDDRKALFQQIAQRLKEFEPTKADATRLEILRKEHQLATESLESRRNTLAHVPEGVELTVGQLLALMAAGEAPISAGSLVDLDRSALGRLLELAERVHPHADLWSPTGWWRQQGERPGLETASDRDLADLARLLDGAIEQAEAARPELEEDPVDEMTLREVRKDLDAVEELLALAKDRDGERLVAALGSHPDVDPAAAAKAWTANEGAMTRWEAPVDAPDAGFRQQVAVLRGFGGSFWRYFSPLWWRTRRAVRETLVSLWPEKAGASMNLELLADLEGRIAAGETWEKTNSFFASLDLEAPQGAEKTRAAMEKLEKAGRSLKTMRAAAEGLSAVGIEVPRRSEEIGPLRTRCARRRAQLVASDRIRGETAKVAPRFPWADREDAEGLRTLRERLRHDGHRLREADGWFIEVDEVLADGRKILDALATELPEGGGADWREALARAWASAQLVRQEAFLPRLADLGGKTDEQRAGEAIDRMRELEGTIADLEVTGIQERLDEAELLRIPDAAYRARRTPEQKTKEKLIKETSKSRRLMPLRTLVREFADSGVLDVLPCWLVSPETMAVLFPRAPLFDLVIFDEASQCTVESGLPVFLRAKQVVVAGDEKQMPPTSFFKLGGSGTDDEDRSEEERRVRDMFESESLLTLTRARCPHAGLKWHYRCREEELIAFSNHAMYEGELRTIPSVTGPAAAPALKWLAVEDGQYDAGMNRPEAERVVDLVGELLGRKKRPSVGVVTFNLKQRQTILDAIDERITRDEVFAERWAEASTHDELDERPFVKNLESVQGDERDIIVFSLGHAPVPRKRRGGQGELYVPARFGPLGQRGGERRLNVAISRAKAECYVVSSFDPKLLHVGSSMHSGPRLFKGYLEYAHALGEGRFNLADRILDDVRGTPRASRERGRRTLLDGHVPVAAQIMMALEERGFRCALDMGTSDFRIPLAVAPAGTSEGEGYAVAVMTDEGFGGESAFEQFVHRPVVLGLRGWKVLHVDAATWRDRSSDVLESITSLVAAG